MMEGGGAMEGEGVVEGGGAHLGSSLPVSVHICGRSSVHSSSLMRVRFRSRGVAFVCGGGHSFVGGRVRSWVVAFVLERSGLFVGGCDIGEVWWWWAVGRWSWSWPGGGCSSWPGGGCSSWPFMVELHGGGVGWLVVVNEDDEQRHASSFVVWLLRRTWGVSKRRLGGSVCLLTWAGHDLSPAVDRVCVLGTGDVAL